MNKLSEKITEINPLNVKMASKVTNSRLVLVLVRNLASVKEKSLTANKLAMMSSAVSFGVLNGSNA